MRLLPDPTDPGLLAEVGLEPSEPAPAELWRLMAAMEPQGLATPRWQAGAELLGQLAEDVTMEGAWLYVLGTLARTPPIGASPRPSPSDGPAGAGVPRRARTALVLTRGDHQLDWLTAGQAFARARLRCRAEGVALASTFHLRGGSAQRRPSLSAPGRQGAPQIVLWIGEGGGPAQVGRPVRAPGGR